MADLFHNPSHDNRWHQWITHEGSLSKQIDQLPLTPLTFNCHRQPCSNATGWEQLLLDETDPQPPHIRFVSWSYQQTPWILGRTLIPARSQSIIELVQAQANQPIGHSLFHSKPPRCYPFIFLSHAMPDDHPMVQDHSFTVIRARRIEYNQQPLIITEYFSPLLKRYLCQQSPHTVG